MSAEFPNLTGKLKNGLLVTNRFITGKTSQRAVPVQAVICQHVLAVMVTAGLYETSGNWLYATGLPGKSGVSGGMITVAPGKGGLASFSPPLDEAGNSVRGQLSARFLSERLGLNLFASRPEGSA
ncbi:MAG: glutaminase [Cyanobacteria bacterium]|nr:glutaminase [Cyanobacteriota bacterium]